MAGCPSLMHLGFIVTSVRGDGNVKGIFGWNEMKCTAFFFVQLVERLPKLIALLIVLPVACQSLCITKCWLKIRHQLSVHYRFIYCRRNRDTE